MALFRIFRPRALVYVAFEGALVFGVIHALGFAVSKFLADGAPGIDEAVLWCSVGYTAILFLTQWSNPGDSSGLVRELVIFGVISLLAGLIVAATIWIVFEGRQQAMAWIPLAAAVAVPITIAIWRWLSSRFPLLNVDRESVLIVGTGATAQSVCRHIAEGHGSEYAILGFAAQNPNRIGSVLSMGARIQTDFENLAKFTLPRADRVIVALDEKRGKLPVRQLMELRLRGLEIEEATTFFERVSGKIAVESMLPSWLIFSDGFKTSTMKSVLKRCTDIANSVVLLVFALPIMAATAILIKLDSRGPVLYKQERLGMDGAPVHVMKFRSMKQDAEKASGPVWATRNDPRVTRIGKIIRKLRIDELPQLFNVLRGEMSFVGPRPEREHFVRQLEQKIPYYGLRLTVRPGLTGWAQVEYRYGETDEDALEKLKYDLYYIKNNNVLFDLWVVLKTVKVVLVGGGQ